MGVGQRPARARANSARLVSIARSSAHGPAVAGPDSAAAWVKPRYADGSLVNLMASIGTALGYVSGRDPGHAPLALLPPESLRDARNIVLLVLDGLGDRYLLRRASTTRLAASRIGSLTSVFPSTTATAITTFLTGASPREHGLTGWHLWLDEIARVVSILPCRTRGEGRPLREAGVNPLRLFREPEPIFSRLEATSACVAPRWIIDSDYNLAHSGTALRFPWQTREHLFERIVEAVHAPAPGRRFIYAYYPEIDASSHDHGPDSLEVAAELWQIDRAYAALLDRLKGTDTAVLVTADHGFIEAPAERNLELDRFPHVAPMLSRPLCGERRLVYAYVRPERSRDFAAAMRADFDGRLDAVPSAQLVSEGWFGPDRGRDHPGFASRIGDWTLIMAPGWTLKDWMPGERRHRLVGVHGGPTAEEMEVPLLLSRC